MSRSKNPISIARAVAIILFITLLAAACGSGISGEIELAQSISEDDQTDAQSSSETIVFPTPCVQTVDPETGEACGVIVSVATPEPEPTATPEPEPTATPEPEPTATPEPIRPAADVGAEEYNAFGVLAASRPASDAECRERIEESRAMRDLWPSELPEDYTFNWNCTDSRSSDYLASGLSDHKWSVSDDLELTPGAILADGSTPDFSVVFEVYPCHENPLFPGAFTVCDLDSDAFDKVLCHNFLMNVGTSDPVEVRKTEGSLHSVVVSPGVNAQYQVKFQFVRHADMSVSDPLDASLFGLAPAARGSWSPEVFFTEGAC